MFCRFSIVVAIMAIQLIPASSMAQDGCLLESDGCQEACCTECGGTSCGSGGGCSTGACGIYYDVRFGAMFQDRNTFRLGKITEDANDLDPGEFVTYAEPGFDVGGDGVAIELVAGRILNSCWKMEGRFSYASLDDTGNSSLADLSGIPLAAGDGGFWVPFIDASAPEHARGIFGMRVRNDINVDFSYNADWYDFGADFIRNVSRDNCRKFDLVFGPSFANINQGFRHVTTGDWDGPEQTSDVREGLDEWFYGAKFGLRYGRAVGRRLSLSAGVAAHAYYHSADLNGSQFVDTAGALGNTYNVAVQDSVDNFSARIGVDAGLTYEVNRCMSLGFLYRLESWHNVSSVANPDLTLLYADGDNRWAGDSAAHLVDDDTVTHSFMGTIEWRR